MTEDTEGPIGRTVRKRVIVVGDESGGWSEKPHGPRSMSIALSETERVYEFGRISEHYPRNTRGKHDDAELKWRSSSDNIRKKVLRDLNDLDPNIFIETDERTGSDIRATERYQDMFRNITEKLISMTDGDHIDFTMDDSPLMRYETAKKIVERIICGTDKTVRYRQVDSIGSPLVQTQDFVAGAANRSRNGEDRFIKIVERKIVSWEEQR